MFRPASRCLLRQTVRPLRNQSSRHLSTAPPHLKSRSWRSSAMRWTIAAAGVYLYNASPLFAEEPASMLRDPPGPEEELPTLQSLSPSSRFQPPHPSDPPSIPPTPKSTSPPSIDPKAPLPPSSEPQSAQELEEDAAQQGAFNEETGEINWDCPCLGGMAHGPCGPEFREAFSCFVFSTEEPKGMDCIDKFKGMQNCFREHPEVYAAELEDDDEDFAQEEGGGGMVASAMPEDSPNVAATEGSARTAVEDTAGSISEAAQKKADQVRSAAGDIKQTATDMADGLSEKATSAKAAAAEAVQNAKDTVAKPEQGARQTPQSDDRNAKKRDGKSGPKKTQQPSSAIDEVQDEIEQRVPRAAKDARGQGESPPAKK